MNAVFQALKTLSLTFESGSDNSDGRKPTNRTLKVSSSHTDISAQFSLPRRFRMREALDDEKDDNFWGTQKLDHDGVVVRERIQKHFELFHARERLTGMMPISGLLTFFWPNHWLWPPQFLIRFTRETKILGLDFGVASRRDQDP